MMRLRAVGTVGMMGKQPRLHSQYIRRQVNCILLHPSSPTKSDGTLSDAKPLH
jgi:hypothetical protein